MEQQLNTHLLQELIIIAWMIFGLLYFIIGFFIAHVTKVIDDIDGSSDEDKAVYTLVGLIFAWPVFVVFVFGLIIIYGIISAIKWIVEKVIEAFRIE